MSSSGQLDIHVIAAALRTRLTVALAVLSICSVGAQRAIADAPPSFRRDVMPALSKAGCNAGTCHGNAKGKGGFRLSLRGFDPAADYRSIVREHGGRRVDLLQPEASLLLAKPTMQLAHEGRKRFGKESWQYNVLRRWLAAGAPPPREDEPQVTKLTVTSRPPNSPSPSEVEHAPAPVGVDGRQIVLIEPQTQLQLGVEAHFSDGAQRDVTPIAVYEMADLVATVSPEGLVQRQAAGETTVLVRYLDRQVAVSIAFVPARPDFAWSDPPENNDIDRRVFAKLKRLRMNPAPLCDDRVFLRRAYLDLLGMLPTAEQAQAFVAEKRPDKRARLIDELLQRPEFAEMWALRWSDILRNEEKTLDAKGVDVFHDWLRESFAEGKPLNQFAHELIAARGSTYENPPANYWRAMRDPITRAEATARLFLGTRLQCAKCHNHPFDRWTQDDYYSWAALFARVDYEIVGKNGRRDKFDNHEFAGEQIVKIKSKGEMRNPRTGRDAAPKFLGAAPPKFGKEDDRLRLLADWLTEGQNDQFARAQVNRIWFYLLGRGLVEPIDDFRATNPPSHPELLTALAEDFAANGYDVRRVVRTIMNSRTYQLASSTNATNAEDAVNYSHNVPRRLTAEQLLDAQCQALDVSAKFNGYAAGTRARQIAGVLRVRLRDAAPGEGDRFLKTFGKPMRLLSCECERNNEANLRQALTLVADESVQQRLARKGNRLDRWASSNDTDQQIIDRLYWTTLSRPPSDEERQAAADLLSAGEDRFAALQDITWALLNSAEFLLRY